MASKLFLRLKMLASRALVSRNKRHVRQVRGPGFELLAFINEDVGRITWLTGSFEPEETRYFQREVRPGDICLDVGGNVGYMAMLFASKANKGHVHVFEPIQINASLIATNAALNNLSNVTVNNVAVGAESGIVTFSVSEDSAYSSINATGRSPEARSIQVPITKIDTYIDEQAIPRVDIVKVDVEGAEEMVIDGASNLLSDPARRPRVVLLELFEPNLTPFGSSIERCVERMAQHSYRPYIIRPGTNNLVRYSPSMSSYLHNVIFLPEE